MELRPRLSVHYTRAGEGAHTSVELRHGVGVETAGRARGERAEEKGF